MELYAQVCKILEPYRELPRTRQALQAGDHHDREVPRQPRSHEVVRVAYSNGTTSARRQQSGHGQVNAQTVPYYCKCRPFFSVKKWTAVERSKISCRHWTAGAYLLATNLKGSPSMKNPAISTSYKSRSGSWLTACWSRGRSWRMWTAWKTRRRSIRRFSAAPIPTCTMARSQEQDDGCGHHGQLTNRIAARPIPEIMKARQGTLSTCALHRTPRNGNCFAF